MISKGKEDYCLLSDKLNDPHTSAKSYWSILSLVTTPVTNASLSSISFKDQDILKG